MARAFCHRIWIVLALLTVWTCGGSGSDDGTVTDNDPPSGSARITTERAFASLAFSAPIALLQAPGDSSRWFLVQQEGQVLEFDDDEAISTTRTFVDISDRVTCCGERGLLGMAFHPNFANNGQVFLSYTGPDVNNNNQLTSFVSRFALNNGALDPSSEDRIISVPQPFSNHNGGYIAFGPDGFLYIGWGDGGSGGDPQDNAQDTGNLLGAMLRIDVNGPNSYGIPAGNPFAGTTCVQGFCPEIFAWGLRNPWRWSFDRDTGELWLGDVGQREWEEVDIIDLGGNYGWRCREGAHDFNTTDCPGGGLMDPVVEYPHGGESKSVTGGYVYRGSSIRGLQGVYVYGDFVDGDLRQFFDDGSGNLIDEILLPTTFSISSFAEDGDGELYLLDYAGGAIYRIVAAL